MNKNLTDTVKDTKGMPAPYEAGGFRSGSYTKTNKLITALYMVTDMIDIGEPIRNKLRTLGVEIISGLNRIPLARTVLASGIDEVMSFLEIASAVNIISEMNFAILKKEFLELKRSIEESKNTKPVWLEEFLSELPLLENSSHPSSLLDKDKDRGNLNSKGHTRIGVQKGSTLLKALSDKTRIMSDRNYSEATSNISGFTPENHFSRDYFDVVKKKRRIEINNVIRKNGGSATITDIRNNTQGSLSSCSEKTLQRELMSMIKDGVLNKTGEKRWSRYFIKN